VVDRLTRGSGLEDPLLETLTDKNMHDVVAYLETLK